MNPEYLQPLMPIMDSLPKQVQALPAELFNKTYDLTFTPATTAPTIDDSYFPPQLLRVNKASRALFAGRYYDPTKTFEIDDNHTCARWLDSLPDEHLRLVRTVRFKPSFNVPQNLVQTMGLDDEGGRSVMGINLALDLRTWLGKRSLRLIDRVMNQGLRVEGRLCMKQGPTYIVSGQVRGTLKDWVATS